VDNKKESFTLGNKSSNVKKTPTKDKALGSIKSEGLKNMLNNL
jgi:hypothetical protein